MSNPTDIWMPLYIGDYLSSTQHLSAEESGAYLHLLMHEWKVGPLPLDVEILRRIARVERDAWSNAWAMLEHFFTRTETGFVQRRLEEEKLQAQQKQEDVTRKAKAAAEKRWGKQQSAEMTDAPAMPEQCPSICSSNARTMLGQCPSPSPSEQIQLHTSLPSSGRRGSAPAACGTEGGHDPPDLRNGAAKVMRECNLSDTRVLTAVLKTLRLEGAKTDEPANWNAIAERMIASQREYVRMAGAGSLRYTVAMRKFFAQGFWCDTGLWAVDREGERRRSQAMIGMAGTDRA